MPDSNPKEEEREPVRRAILILVASIGLTATDAGAHLDDIFSFYCPTGLGDGSSSCPSCDELDMVESEIRFHVAPELFTWRSKYVPDGQGRLPDAIWILVSEGPDPQETTEEFAILYGDVTTGRVSAYVYGKDDGGDSWQTQPFIASFPNALTTSVSGGVTELNLVIDATIINSFPGPPTWKGVFFSWTIGFWAAALCNTSFEFGPSGEILNFTSTTGNLGDCRCSYDRNDRTSGPPIPVEGASWGRVKSQYRE
jgi:hypothetical protein